MSKLLAFLFGCRHANTSWPFGNRERGVETYKVCLDCGKRIPYKF
jgi:hypothetical protein